MNDRVLADGAFEQHREPARQQFGMAARNRHDSAFADIEGDRRDMGGGVASRWLILGGRRIRPFRREQVGERDRAVGKIFTEAAHITDGKHVRSDAHRALRLIEGADAIAGDDGLGADARKRRRRIGAPAQQRQRRDDHAGPQHGERRQEIFNDVRQVDGDDRIGWQSHVAQARRERAHRAIGLRIGQAARLTADGGRAVCRIDKGGRIGTAPGMAAENVVNREGEAA